MGGGSHDSPCHSHRPLAPACLHCRAGGRDVLGTASQMWTSYFYDTWKTDGTTTNKESLRAPVAPPQPPSSATLLIALAVVVNGVGAVGEGFAAARPYGL